MFTATLSFAAPAPSAAPAALSLPSSLIVRGGSHGDRGTERGAVGGRGDLRDAPLPALDVLTVLPGRARDDVEQIERFGKERLPDERPGRRALPVRAGKETPLRDQDLAYAVPVALRNDEPLFEPADDLVDRGEHPGTPLRVGSLERMVHEGVEQKGEKGRVAELRAARRCEIERVERLQLELAIFGPHGGRHLRHHDTVHAQLIEERHRRLRSSLAEHAEKILEDAGGRGARDVPLVTADRMQ